MLLFELGLAVHNCNLGLASQAQPGIQPATALSLSKCGITQRQQLRPRYKSLPATRSKHITSRDHLSRSQGDGGGVPPSLSV